MGEGWAAEERQQYANSTRIIKATIPAIRSEMKDMVLTSGGPSIPWEKARLYIAYYFGLSVRQLYPGLSAISSYRNRAPGFGPGARPCVVFEV